MHAEISACLPTPAPGLRKTTIRTCHHPVGRSLDSPAARPPSASSKIEFSGRRDRFHLLVPRAVLHLKPTRQLPKILLGKLGDGGRDFHDRAHERWAQPIRRPCANAERGWRDVRLRRTVSAILPSDPHENEACGFHEFPAPEASLFREVRTHRPMHAEISACMGMPAPGSGKADASGYASTSRHFWSSRALMA